jgi:monoamine oxidase
MIQASELLDQDVIIVGAGAAGIAAGLRLAQSRLRFLIVEGRSRLGGRAATVTAGGYPIDLGCGWLHSADRNPWTRRLAESGFTIDKTPPGWDRQSFDLGFSPEDQEAFGEAWEAFQARLEAAGDEAVDQAAKALLEPGERFNALLEAVSTYISGVELDRLSVQDAARYDDSGINWRVVEGYGAAIVAQATDVPGISLPVKLGCHVSRIEHGGRHLRIVTSAGSLRARAVIVTIPTNLLVSEKLAFDPPLPEKSAAAEGLPLGLANKFTLKIDQPDRLPENGHLFGRTDRVETASYHLRPFGRDVIEAYFGGALASTLEDEGEAGFFAFVADELAGLFGSEIRARLHPLVHSAWGKDPYARGSYSYALPGRAGARAKLAEAVEDRIFFAGEACSLRDFSTAHGAYQTGVGAAEAVLATYGDLVSLREPVII